MAFSPTRIAPFAKFDPPFDSCYGYNTVTVLVLSLSPYGLLVVPLARSSQTAPWRFTPRFTNFDHSGLFFIVFNALPVLYLLFKALTPGKTDLLGASWNRSVKVEASQCWVHTPVWPTVGKFFN